MVCYAIRIRPKSSELSDATDCSRHLWDGWVATRLDVLQPKPPDNCHYRQTSGNGVYQDQPSRHRFRKRTPHLTFLRVPRIPPGVVDQRSKGRAPASHSSALLLTELVLADARSITNSRTICAGQRVPDEKVYRHFLELNSRCPQSRLWATTSASAIPRFAQRRGTSTRTIGRRTGIDNMEKNLSFHKG
jgi:hypothetical protein